MPRSRRRGLSFDGMPGINHCLHCGMCVEVCEQVTHKRPGHPAMGLRRLHRKPRRLVRPAAVPPLAAEPTQQPAVDGESTQ